MDNSTRRIPIKVSANPSEYSGGRSVRFNNNNSINNFGSGFYNTNSSNLDIKEKMNQRMREFEEESRKWRDQFLSQSGLPSSTSTSIDQNRPRMFVNFPDFPDMNTGFSSPLSSLSSRGAPTSFFQTTSPFVTQSSHKSFIEEDDNGQKKYKMTFDIGDFKPNEIQVRTEGRQLIVKGDRELIAGTASESKQFNREITLPDFIEPTSVVSFLSDGILTVEAPVLMDRLGVGYNPASSSITNTSSSTIRNSPYRDNSSPSKASVLLNQQAVPSTLASNTNNSRSQYRNDLLNSSQSSQSSSATTISNSNVAANNSINNNSNNNNSNFVLSSESQAQSLPAIPTSASYKFNMSEFRPEDIAITVTDTTLKVHALREENDIRGNGKTYREFKREIGLPQGADVKRLKNSLQSDGTLLIEIPVQDNSQFRPPLSPIGLNKQFGNFSLNDNLVTSNNSSLLSSSSNSNNLAATTNTNTNGLVDQTNTGKELKLTFDLTGYKPEDLNIKVIDNNVLKVNAVHIDNTRGNQIHREYTRQYILPEWVQPEALRARMSDDGTLTVEIPLPQLQPNKLERVINIQNN